MIVLLWILIGIFTIGVLGYHRASLAVYSLSISIFLLFFSIFNFLTLSQLITIGSCWVILAVILNWRWLRSQLLSRGVMRLYRQKMPKFSATEQAVLHAGNIGWEAELFSGMPDWQKLWDLPWVKLTAEEQEFLDGPVNQLCHLIDPWEISRSMQIPAQIWERIKQDGYFGLVIPKQYNGKGFSAFAHAQVIMKIASVSSAVATVVAVPNSLGPAELLLHYGSNQQKEYYLPRLARGEEVPCFALTSIVAGSDAASIIDNGIVGYFEIEGKKQLGICLNWDKRYITLAPVASLLGLAFKLYDPEHYLGEKEYFGITCALVPTQTKGVKIGRRHYPLDSAFPNGPTQGENVIVPMDAIIGGVEQAGQGWRMLMERLATGRGISLPSISLAAIKRAALGSGAYARFRRQFNTFIGDFGGIQKALAEISGDAFIAESLRLLGLAQLDNHIHSATTAAISKLHTTELARKVISHAMDIHGGKGICMGPNNYLAQLHIEGPIALTVEGANILTRSMIIFGQGALRCHPYFLKELEAVINNDLNSFDHSLFAHLGYIVSNKIRALILGLRNSSNIIVQVDRFSAVLAFIADVMMITLGNRLKRREELSWRLGDLLSYLLMMSAILKYRQAQTLTVQEQSVMEWCCRKLLFICQQELDELLVNLPNRLMAGILRVIIFPLGKRLKAPTDKLSSQIARYLLAPDPVRERLAAGIYFGGNSDPLHDLEQRLQEIIAVEPLLSKIHQAEITHKIKGKNLHDLITAAQSANILTADEAKQVILAEKIRMEMLKVDDYESL